MYIKKEGPSSGNSLAAEFDRWCASAWMLRTIVVKWVIENTVWKGCLGSEAMAGLWYRTREKVTGSQTCYAWAKAWRWHLAQADCPERTRRWQVGWGHVSVEDQGPGWSPVLGFDLTEQRMGKSVWLVQQRSDIKKLIIFRRINLVALWDIWINKRKMRRSRCSTNLGKLK